VLESQPIHRPWQHYRIVDGHRRGGGRICHWLQTIEGITSPNGQISYVRSAFLPGQSHCICIFELTSRELVRQVNETAQIPFARIEPAFDFNCEEVRQ
jgi:hypothetical protein